MEIKQLEELGYYTLVEEIKSIRKHQYFNRPMPEDVTLSGMFNWANSPQKHNFWFLVYKGEFEEAKIYNRGIFKHLFVNSLIDNAPYKITTNGLFK